MKKTLVLIMILCMLSSISFAVETLYQNVNESRISTGTILKNYVRFTDKGWLNINVLEVNVDDKYTDLTLLTSSNGLGTLQNLKTMAENSGSIAAINGDFFAANSGRGNAVGLSMRDDEIFTSAYAPNEQKNNFATFLLDEDNNPLFEYLTSTIVLESLKTNNTIVVSDVNKFSANYAIPAIYTPNWGTYSMGASEDLPMTEMVVQDNKVIEIRQNQEAVKIPENGFVVSTVGNGSNFILENFKVGTKVSLDVSYNIDLDNISFAVSGGSVLIKDGVVSSTFTDNVSGTHPRTAIGSSKDGKTIYLVTIDGRQTSSIGVSQKELAEFLSEIDVYNAINLDGGGSTTMVAKKLGDSKLSTINLPSGGSLRSIINGVGVFSTAPSSSTLYGLTIEVNDTNVFKGKQRIINVKGYNKYYNPIEIDKEDIVWSYSGVPLNVENGILTGNTVGSSMLTATIGNVHESIEINILSDVNELSISPKKVTISSGEKVSFKISAKNKNGYYSTLNNNEVTWKLEKGNGTLTGNTFTAIDSRRLYYIC